MQNERIIIAGGGIGGLFTAIALRHQGIKSIILESNSEPNPAGAGLVLWPNATAILEQYGLLQQVINHGYVLNTMKTATLSGTFLNMVHLSKLEQRFGFPTISITRASLNGILLDAIPENTILFNRQCTGISQEDNQVLIQCKDGSSFLSPVLIAANGIHSMIRKELGEAAVTYSGRTSWRGIAPLPASLIPGTAYEFLGKGKRAGIFPLPHQQVYWYASVNMREKTSRQQTASSYSVLSHFDQAPHTLRNLIGNTPAEKIILTNINYASSIRSLAKNRVALLGDAAHPMTPDLGQGACQAIEDGHTLAQCLALPGDPVTGLMLYEKRRLKRVKKIALNSYRMGKMRQTENPLTLALRNVMMKYMPEQLVLKILSGNIQSDIFKKSSLS